MITDVMDIIDIIILICLWGRVAWLKCFYTKQDAICLEYTTTNTASTIRPLFEYEIIENGKRVIYKNRGTAMIGLIKGKRCKVLVNKKDHNKVVGYNEYVTMVIVGIIYASCVI